MTDKNYTALLMILDRSGSMHNIKPEMESAIKEFLAGQCATEGMVTVDALLFDHEIEAQYVMCAPEKVDIKIEPRGSTALLDAMGFGITAFWSRLDALPEHAKPEHRIVVVVTDGEENASQEYGPSAVRDLVKAKTAGGAQFIFLGADQDAITAGTELGIEPTKSMKFAKNATSVLATKDGLNRLVTDIRGGKTETGFTEDERRLSDEGEGAA